MKLWAVVVFVGRSSRRVAVTVVGVALVAAGFAGIVLPLLPGPLLIIAGLAVLATEYVWARRALDVAKRRANQARDKVRARRQRKRDSEGPGAPPPGEDGPNLWR
ncbi:MAG: PGPGW domain-containing protein [Acidimicrobiia bacterium]